MVVLVSSEEKTRKYTFQRVYSLYGVYLMKSRILDEAQPSYAKMRVENVDSITSSVGETPFFGILDPSATLCQ